MKSFNNFFVEARTKAGLDAQKKGLVHTGKGYYADGSGNIVAKAENLHSVDTLLGWTPLYIAGKNGFMDIYKLLITKRA